MNNPIWWDTTITIYNKYEDPQTHVVSWYRSVVSGCFWKASGDKVSVGSVELNSKSILCRIPKDSRFLEKFDWEQLPNDQMSAHFTLGLEDIIVKGEVSDVINEYADGHRSTDLLDKYKPSQRCFEIEEYSNNTGAGRNNEHYFVRGK